MITAVKMCVFASPLMVAGIVIGLVLFLSVIIIIIGSMKKRKSVSLNTDGFSYGGSVGDLRSVCIDDFPPASDLDLEMISYFDITYPDAPPQYDECIGPGATQLFIPTDDPPPYSHPSHTFFHMERAGLAADAGLIYPVSFQDSQGQRIASVSASYSSLDELPPYEVVMEQQNRTIPLMSVV